jgi:UDP-glucuronate 4-epimerase
MGQKEKILITGILGFIGFHAAIRLQNKGHEIIGFDHVNDYYDIRYKFLRLDHLKALSIQVYYLDLIDFHSLKEFIQKEKPTKILHLAAQAGVRYSLENPNAYMQSNCIGFYHILEIAKEKKIPIVYASSSSVYGENQKVPFSETDLTENQLSLYAVTKKTNELFAHTYHHLFQIPLIGLRFFTVYGPYGRPDMAYFSFTQKILKKEPITVYNQGELKRDFTYIDDIVDGIESALSFPVPFGIFNLGNHQPIAVRELVEILESLLQEKAIIKDAPAPILDVPITYADIEKSGAILHYKPKTSLQVGLKQFVDWYLTEGRSLPSLDEMKKKHPEFFQSKMSL